MNLTKENKLDAVGAVFAFVGIAVILASQFSLPWMGLGAAIVILTAIIRVWSFLASKHG